VTFPVSTPCWFDVRGGAPTLNNAAGSLLEVLRACLINGFGAVSVTSIVVAGGVATATAATHGFSSAYGKLVLIEGAPVAGLNGRKRIENVLTNTFTYPAPGVPDGTYTGTISARRAPLGWAEAHSGSSKAILARTAPEATSMMLRIDDTHVSPSTATDARITSVESATGVDAFTNQSPTTAQVSGGYHVCKGPNNATAKRWFLIGCDRSFWFATQATASSADPLQLCFFGDLVSYFSPDPYSSVIAGATAGYSGTANNSLLGSWANINLASLLNGNRITLARDEDSTVVSVIANPVGLFSSAANGNIIGGSGLAANLAVGRNVPVNPYVWVQQPTRAVRGHFPGLQAPIGYALPFQDMTVLSNVGGSGRNLLSVRVGTVYGQANPLFDLTEPWY
jgi:hypothetical protein